MNTNTKKHERAIKSLAAHCWDKSNKTTYTMQHIKAVIKSVSALYIARAIMPHVYMKSMSMICLIAQK